MLLKWITTLPPNLPTKTVQQACLTMTMDPSLHSQSQSLLVRLASQCSVKQSFSSMSPSIYGTAWLSMVQQPANSGVWL